MHPEVISHLRRSTDINFEIEKRSSGSLGKALSDGRLTNRDLYLYCAFNEAYIQAGQDLVSMGQLSEGFDFPGSEDTESVQKVNDRAMRLLSYLYQENINLIRLKMDLLNGKLETIVGYRVLN